MLSDKTHEAGDAGEGRWVTSLAVVVSHERADADLGMKELISIYHFLKNTILGKNKYLFISYHNVVELKRETQT